MVKKSLKRHQRTNTKISNNFGSTAFCVEATIGKAESLIIISVGRSPCESDSINKVKKKFEVL